MFLPSRHQGSVQAPQVAARRAVGGDLVNGKFASRALGRGRVGASNGRQRIRGGDMFPACMYTNVDGWENVNVSGGVQRLGFNFRKPRLH